ncbi:hypothetical protein IQ266_21915 [filamentous cyanobacterium LEGE 11480]|uniref:DUF4159 domain-containing protein n=1 Tax=Romeriopsis navalis LEGE 11480 TaxID=2777977 RepID=A0A928VUD1_9CYAN|nr:hypothetical protein [Romeriopsis navalis]MBE9032399.1 hypothetical protein [Romeriopsis navalis LEGE 11480]
MTNAFFERLHIGSDRLITVDRWRQVHDYHRRRQNWYYQALYQPGIIEGLGISVDNQDGLTLIIQPGAAIDNQGNPIIVPTQETFKFRIQTRPESEKELQIYIVLQAVDPNDLKGLPQETQTVPEYFKIHERRKLQPGDIELCRILLNADQDVLEVSSPKDPFFPKPNELDFRYRPIPRPRTSFDIQVGAVVTSSDHIQSAPYLIKGWTDLIASIPSLYPRLSAHSMVQQYSPTELGELNVQSCQLLHLPYRILGTLDRGWLMPILDRFIQDGGTVLVSIDIDQINDLMENRNFAEHLQIFRALKLEARQLDYAFTDRHKYGSQETANSLKGAIDSEIEDYSAEILSDLSHLIQKINQTHRMGFDDEHAELELEHPLRRFPFPFSQLPTYKGYPVYVKQQGGWILMLGDLNEVWSIDPNFDCSREVLRSAQEFGINILHFAAQRWQQINYANYQITD